MAAGIGLSKAANMVILGAYLELTGILAPESLMKALEKTLPERHRHTLPLNKQAMLAGSELIKKMAAAKCSA